MSRINYSTISPFHQEPNTPKPQPNKTAEPDNATAIEPMLYNTKQAAHLLGIGKTGLFQLINERRIRSVKVFSRRMISRQAIEEFINELDQEAG